MKVCNGFAVFAFLSLFAATGALASRASGEASAAESVPAATAVEHVRWDAPIVMGRSVSLHRKTKLHHIKVKPIEPADKPATPEEAE